MIEFYGMTTNHTTVVVNRRVIGEIRKVKGGFQFFGKEQRGSGAVLPTLVEVKQALQKR